MQANLDDLEIEEQLHLKAKADVTRLELPYSAFTHQQAGPAESLIYIFRSRNSALI